ncbi:alpha/beta fold hydrolase [Pseudorhodoferax sp. Leaf267]|uniref:alpha/beta fold hydrolase n=1 Tax=Pseudorhodoferax sp. Leaf267 TaxID=1736316 RepID=UPI0012E30C54|nr:alpha/beta hydrolase [Pseudorhodoferax sp. Leaf267]
MQPRARDRHSVETAGAGPTTIVFSHGFGCDRTIWRFVAPAFEETHQTLVYDHAGSGGAVQAWDPQRHASLEGYAQDLLDILEEEGLQNVVGVGHSVGGIIMMLAAIAQPQRFSRLFFICPSPRFLNDPPHYKGGFERADIDGLFQLMESNHYGWAQFLAPLAMGDANPVALTREFEGALRALEPRIAQAFARLVFLVDVRDRLHELARPSVIVQCLDDSIAPVEVGRWMHGHLANSALVELDASGHCPHVSHPQEIIAILRARLDGPGTA